MGRKRISGSKGRDNRSERGLKIKERDGFLYISGTVTVRGQSIRIRKTTGLAASAEGSWELAEEIIAKTRTEIQDQIIHGVKPSPRFWEIVAAYNASRTAGPTDAANLTELVERFRNVRVNRLNRTIIDRFYRERFPHHSAATIRRHQRSLAAVLNYAINEELIETAPIFSRPKAERKKGGNMNKKFLPGEAELIIDCADWHLKPVLATLFSTGARVSMTLVLSKTDFILAKGRGRVFFPDSKNGNAYSRPLHDYTTDILKAWLESREGKDDFPEMFLTPKNRPYKIHAGRGGYIKVGFDQAISQATKILANKSMTDRARVIARATPHWFRHNLANTLRQDMKADVKTIMEAGMWESPKVLLDNYFGDTHEATDKLVKSLPFGTKLTQRDVEDG